MKRYEEPEQTRTDDASVVVTSSVREGDTVEHHYHNLVATVSPGAVLITGLGLFINHEERSVGCCVECEGGGFSGAERHYHNLVATVSPRERC